MRGTTEPSHFEWRSKALAHSSISATPFIMSAKFMDSAMMPAKTQTRDLAQPPVLPPKPGRNSAERGDGGDGTDNGKTSGRDGDVTQRSVHVLRMLALATTSGKEELLWI